MSPSVVASGCVVTRRADSEILLVHPRGASFHRPLFGIPKGKVDHGEDPQAAAVRETLEETGVMVCVRMSLGSVLQKGGRKLVFGFWAHVAEGGEAAIDDDGRCRFGDDENDVCGFYPIDQAREMMVPAQVELLDRLQGYITRRVTG